MEGGGDGSAAARGTKNELQPTTALHVAGNVSDDEKKLATRIFYHFISTREESYGADVGQRLKLAELNVYGRGTPTACAETVVEIEVTRDMCNVYGTLHGGCAVYIIDPCSMSALVLLGIATGIDGTGVSQSMNIIWHQPAKVGVKLRIVSTSIFLEGRIRVARSEIWNGDKLCITAVHSTMNPKAEKARDSRKSKL